MAKPRVFVSYARGDEKSSRLMGSLSEALRTAGVGVWLDNTSIAPGQDWISGIERALEDSETFVFLLSPRALKSDWTNFEMGVAARRAAQSRNVRIIPVLVGGTDWGSVPAFLHRKSAIDADKASEDEVAAAVTRAVTSDMTAGD